MVNKAILPDVPTGSDALEPASEVSNLFRCSWGSTGDDTRPLLETVFKEFLEHYMYSLMAGEIPTARPRLRCQLIGDLLVSLRGAAAEHPMRYLDPDNFGLVQSVARDEGVSRGFAPARLLRDLSKLDASRLGELVGVSRTTYQAWLKGSKPRGKKLELVGRLLSLMEEATEVRGTADLDVWLRTPVEAGGPSPFDLLKEGRYRAFRGLAHRIPIEERMMRRSSVRSRTRGISQGEWSRRAERVARTTWVEEDEDTLAE
jgi:transcriptional regulator with XRE-family HTH domain